MSYPLNTPEKEYLARHVRQSWINCGRPHAELVATGFESDFSMTLDPGELMRRAEEMKADEEIPE